MGKGATSVAGKYLFRADDVWWRCALTTIDVCICFCLFVGSYSQGVEYWIKSDPYVCIWHMFVSMSVVSTVWGSVGMFVV